MEIIQCGNPEKQNYSFSYSCILSNQSRKSYKVQTNAYFLGFDKSSASASFAFLARIPHNRATALD